MSFLPILHSDQNQRNFVLLPWHANYGEGNNQRHIHPVYHFLFIMEGGGYIERDSYNQPSNAGDLLIINPNELHLFHADEKTGQQFYALSFYLIAQENLPLLGGSAVLQGYVDLNHLDKLAETTKLEELFQLQMFQNQQIVRATPELWTSLLQLIQIYDHRFTVLNPGFKKFWLDPKTMDKAGFTLLSTLFLIELLDLFVRITKQEPAAGKSDPLLTRLYHYFDTLVFDKYNQQTLGAQLNYNPVYLTAYFKKKTGLTPQVYIDRQKIRQACIELNETNCSIDDLANRLHYSSPGHFCNNFKRAMQLTPKQYRSISLQ